MAKKLPPRGTNAGYAPLREVNMGRATFYRLEGRLIQPPESAYAGELTEWMILDGRTHIRGLEHARDKARAALEDYDLDQVRIVKVTHEVVAGASRKRKGGDHVS